MRVGFSGISPHGVEVEDRVERSAAPDPVVDVLAGCFAVRGAGARTADGRESGAEHRYIVRVRSFDNLPVRGDEIRRADRCIGLHDPGELRIYIAVRDGVGDVVHAPEQD